MKLRKICAGFDQDQSGDTRYADLGTALHWAVEHEDLSKLTEPEYIDAAKQCIEFSKKISSGADEIFREIKLDISKMTFGTCDFAALFKKRRHMEAADYKAGLHEVDDPSENYQAVCYVVGLFERFPVDTVRFWFVMPRIDVVMSHVFYRSQMPGMRAAIKTVVDAAARYRKTGDVSLLHRTEESCQYCANKLKCPLYTEYALAIAHKYDPLEVPSEVHSSQVTDPAQMIKLYTAARVLEKFVDSVKEHARDLATANGGKLCDERGNVVYQYVEQRGNRRFKSLGAAIDVLRAYLSDAELLSLADIPLGAALELISEKAPKGKKSAVRGAVEKALNEADAITEGEPKRFLKKIKQPKQKETV